MVVGVPLASSSVTVIDGVAHLFPSCRAQSSAIWLSQHVLRGKIFLTRLSFPSFTPSFFSIDPFRVLSGWERTV